MIDYISLTLDLRHDPIPAGKVLAIDSNGVQEWCSPKSFDCAGSHESKIRLRSQGDLDHEGRAARLFLSGNPAKFLQGHNIFGSEHLFYMLQAVFKKIQSTYDFHFDDLFLANALPRAQVSRIDFTRSIQFPNRTIVRSYINQLALRATARHGRPKLTNTTLTFGERSRRWQFIVYSKGDEVQKNKLHHMLPHRDFIQEQADALCRCELRLRTLELRDIECRTVSDLTPSRLNQLYEKYIGRIQMNTIAELPSDVLISLPRCARDTYMMWREGIPVSSVMKYSTYRRHVSILEKYGIDISIPFDNEALSNIIPLTRAIEGQPYQVPQFAYDNNLIFQPRLLAVRA